MPRPIPTEKRSLSNNHFQQIPILVTIIISF